MSEEQIKEYREQLLQAQLSYCYKNSELYRRMFQEVGFEPQDIKTFEDFQKLPVLMNKDRERESQAESIEKLGHPFGMHLCCRPEEVVIMGSTSGTTGVPTYTYSLTRSDLQALNEYWVHIFKYIGIHPGDRVLFAHALGIYATTCVEDGIRAAGCLPVDVDVRGGAHFILDSARLTRPHAAFMTPSLAEYLVDRAPQIIGMSMRDFKFKALCCVGEVGIGVPEIKQKIEDGFGCRVYDWIGPIGGTLAISCNSDEYYGMHALTSHGDLYPDDLVDPETKKPLEIKDGVIGEAIYTSLNRRACPMIRFASGDMVQVFTEECPNCGFKGRRLKVVGRSDDMIIVKGTNIYPAAIKKSIAQFIPEITGEMRVVLNTPPPRIVPPLELKLEYGINTEQKDLSDLEERIKKALSFEVKVNPKIVWVEPKALEKSLAKTPVFENNY